ncbi:hypothetical protein [Stomatohabitans albus]|uniref:hypothetical protein n=1 Tax=Stomatohabitans albus TaxID=3110766 RepID=UPI00300C8672
MNAHHIPGGGNHPIEETEEIYTISVHHIPGETHPLDDEEVQAHHVPGQTHPLDDEEETPVEDRLLALV